MKPIVRYQCEYCNKHFAGSKYAESHEKHCWANPKNKACRSCAHQRRETNPNYDRSHYCSIYHGDGRNYRKCEKWEDRYAIE